MSGCPVYTSRRCCGIHSRKPKLPTVLRWNTMSSNSFAIVSVATSKLKMKLKMLPAGFSVAPCRTAIQFFDRHSSRSFLLLRMLILSLTLLILSTYRSKRLPQFLQVSVLLFEGIVLMLSKRFLETIGIQTKNPMFGDLQPFSFRSCV